jgi:hypothetical protein
MKRIIRLTESDLTRIIKRVISEKVETTSFTPISLGSKISQSGKTLKSINIKGNTFDNFTITNIVSSPTTDKKSFEVTVVTETDNGGYRDTSSVVCKRKDSQSDDFYSSSYDKSSTTTTFKKEGTKYEYGGLFFNLNPEKTAYVTDSGRMTLEQYLGTPPQPVISQMNTYCKSLCGTSLCK